MSSWSLRILSGGNYKLHPEGHGALQIGAVNSAHKEGLSSIPEESKGESLVSSMDSGTEAKLNSVVLPPPTPRDLCRPLGGRGQHFWHEWRWCGHIWQLVIQWLLRREREEEKERG